MYACQYIIAVMRVISKAGVMTSFLATDANRKILLSLVLVCLIMLHACQLMPIDKCSFASDKRAPELVGQGPPLHIALLFSSISS
jgi:hypothetical protein